MLKRAFVKLLLPTLALAGGQSAAHAENVGLIASIVGDVQVTRAPGSKTGKASVMQPLPAGSSVRVGPTGRAIVILFQSGARYELGPASVTNLSDQGLRGVSGPAPKSLSALQIRQAKLLAGSRVASGRAASTILRTGPSHLQLQSLSATSVLESRPTFAWSAVKGASSYKVRLWNDEDQVIWQSEAQNTSLAYPADAVALKPEIDYLWTVTTSVGDTLFKGEGLFRVLDAQKIEAVKTEIAALEADKDSDEAVTGVLRAEVYARNELWDDAILAYQQLQAKFPDSEDIRDGLNTLLAGQSRSVAASAPGAAATVSVPVKP
jgi:hypothetical protein